MIEIRIIEDILYSISVVVIDTGGRYMDPQVVRFIPDVPQNVPNLVLSQTYPEDGDGDTINITVSWNEPFFSSRPNISSYVMNHNVTSPDTSITIPAPTTTYNIPDATIGSVYTIRIAAVNVLGTGVNTSATIRIVSTVVPTSTSMIKSSSVITDTSTIQSTSSTAEATLIPNTSSTPTTKNSNKAGFPTGAIIGIGTGVVVITIVILIELIVVGCQIWHKPGKGKKENIATTNNVVIYDTPTNTVQFPNVSVSMNTAYGAATASRGVVHTSDNVAYGHTNNNTGARQPTGISNTAVYETVR